MKLQSIVITKMLNVCGFFPINAKIAEFYDIFALYNLLVGLFIFKTAVFNFHFFINTDPCILIKLTSKL